MNKQKMRPDYFPFSLPMARMKPSFVNAHLEQGSIGKEQTSYKDKAGYEYRIVWIAPTRHAFEVVKFKTLFCIISCQTHRIAGKEERIAVIKPHNHSEYWKIIDPAIASLLNNHEG